VLRVTIAPFAGLPVHFDPRSAKIRVQLAHLHVFRVTQSLNIANPAAVVPDAVSRPLQVFHAPFFYFSIFARK
jgi:hypothetical protein